MTRIPLSNFLLSVICFNFVGLSDFVISQVNTDIAEIEQTVFKEARVSRRIRWFRPANMSEYGKFMVCVDAYQKKIGTRLMDQHYITENGTTALPNFEINVLNIRLTLIKNHSSFSQMVMHCPLDKVQFSALNYSYGEDFYISDSSDKLCIYLFTPIIENLEQYPTLKVTAKICELLLNIRYNRLDLEQEVAEKSGLGLLEWNVIERLDNDIRFIICLDIHEKFTRTQLYSYSFTTNYHENKLPIFSIVHKNLSLSNGVEESIIEVLHCPLNEIKFPDHQNMDPFFLARSYKADCVYKMEPIDSCDLQQATTFRIKAEICGIFGFLDEDTDYLERDLVERINILKNPSFDFFSWNHLSSIPQYGRFLMCINAMKKVHMEYFFMKHDITVRTGRQFPTVYNSKLKLEQHGMANRPLHVFKCPMEKYSNHTLAKKSFYIADSPRIGCVYTLSFVNPDITSTSSFMSLKIKNLICGIYPSRYFLHLDFRHIIRPII